MSTDIYTVARRVVKDYGLQWCVLYPDGRVRAHSDHHKLMQRLADRLTRFNREPVKDEVAAKRETSRGL